MKKDYCWTCGKEMPLVIDDDERTVWECPNKCEAITKAKTQSVFDELMKSVGGDQQDD